MLIDVCSEFADLSFCIGFVVFFKRLNEHVNERSERASEMILWVQRQYEKLRVKYEEWENETLASSLGNTQNPDFLDAVHDCYDYTSLYFKRLHQRQRHFRIYPRLVFLHINHAVYYWGDATKNIREGNARKAPPDMQDWLVEGAHLYWDYLPSIAKALMNECNRLSEDRVYEAWIMMMFRAFCWWRCHWMDLSETMENSGKPKTRLPSRYYNSKFPVYIG